jgi:hypothetical protein
MRMGICTDVSIAQGLRVKRLGDTMKGEDVELVLCLLPTLARRREEHPRESHFLDAPDEHAVGSEMRDHLGID